MTDESTRSKDNDKNKKISTKYYEEELQKLQIELVKLQDWIQHKGLKVVVIFEGRDAAGKGGVIKRISQSLNPRVCKIVALGTPSSREKSQWYFQRYVPHLPSAGEMILFDRSWYNRAGVEHVMGFCTDKEYKRFKKNCAGFERALVEDGVTLIKYWLTVSNKEQERRFRRRIEDPVRQWKLSPMDLESRRRWYDFSRARDAMMAATDTDYAPWTIVPSDDKRRARLNCIHHLLRAIPYKDLPREKIALPRRDKTDAYDDLMPLVSKRYVPEKF